MPRTPKTSFKRETELLFGALTSMGNEHDKAAAVVVLYLNKLVAELRKTDWTKANLKTLELLEKDMRKDYKIDIKIDLEDPEREKMMKKLTYQAAMTLLAKAQLLADGRPPQAAVQIGDFFSAGSLEDLTDNLRAMGGEIDEPDLTPEKKEGDADEEDEK